jgi:hypothetical protein
VFISFNNVLDYNIKAQDSELGKVKDLFFDIKDWTVKYLVVDSRKWLPGKKILLSPQCISPRHPLGEDGHIYVDLTRDMIEKGPAPEEETEVSRKMLDEINDYYSWHSFWVESARILSAPLAGVPFYYHDLHTAPSPVSTVTPEEPGGEVDEEELRILSCREMLHYTVTTQEGEECRMQDFLLDTSRWQLLYFVVSSGEFFGGNTTLVPPLMVATISRIDERTRIELTKEQIETAPPFDIDSFDEIYENLLLKHYFKDSYKITSRHKDAGSF